MSHGWRQVLPFRWDAETATLHRRDPEGATALRQSSSGELSLEHEEADSSAAARLGAMLAFDLDLEPFYALCGADRTLGWVPERGAGRVLRGRDAWEDASKGICFTNIAWRQAVQCINRLGEAGVSGCWPAPAQVLLRGAAWLRGHCRVGYRARYIVQLAEGFHEGQFERSARSRRDFQAMPGIGPATAAYLAGMWGSWDVVSFDSSVAALLRKRYGIEKPRKEDADARYSTFGDLRGLACLMDLHGWSRGLTR